MNHILVTVIGWKLNFSHQEGDLVGGGGPADNKGWKLNYPESDKKFIGQTDAILLIHSFTYDMGVQEAP